MIILNIFNLITLNITRSLNGNFQDTVVNTNNTSIKVTKGD